VLTPEQYSLPAPRAEFKKLDRLGEGESVTLDRETFVVANGYAWVPCKALLAQCRQDQLIVKATPERVVLDPGLCHIERSQFPCPGFITSRYVAKEFAKHLAAAVADPRVEEEEPEEVPLDYPDADDYLFAESFDPEAERAQAKREKAQEADDALLEHHERLVTTQKDGRGKNRDAAPPASEG